RLKSAAGDLASVLAARAAKVTGALLESLLALLFTTATMFFVSRNWAELARRTVRLMPINPHHTRRLLREAQRLGRTVVIGNFGTALAQGAVAGAGFAMARVPEAAFLGAMTAVTSLVPVVGTLVVWVPTALFLFASDRPRAGVFVLVRGTVAIVGLCDFVVRPRLVGSGDLENDGVTNAPAAAILRGRSLKKGVEVEGGAGRASHLSTPAPCSLAVSAERGNIRPSSRGSRCGGSDRGQRRSPVSGPSAARLVQARQAVGREANVVTPRSRAQSFPVVFGDQMRRQGLDGQAHSRGDGDDQGCQIRSLRSDDERSSRRCGRAREGGAGARRGPRHAGGLLDVRPERHVRSGLRPRASTADHHSGQQGKPVGRGTARLLPVHRNHAGPAAPRRPWRRGIRGISKHPRRVGGVECVSRALAQEAPGSAYRALAGSRAPVRNDAWHLARAVERGRCPPRRQRAPSVRERMVRSSGRRPPRRRVSRARGGRALLPAVKY